MFAYRAALVRAEVAFTDRHGGTSAPPFDSLDLGDADGSDADAAERNHTRVAVALGADPDQVVRMRQVHGADIALVRSEAVGGQPLGQWPVVDAVITDEPGLLLCARVADCAPVLLADPEAGIVAAVHAGRSGLTAGVVSRAVDQMRAIGAERITGWVGPRICGFCYEVPERLQAEVASAVPASLATTSWGTPALDIGAGVAAQLRAAGCDVVDVAQCTRESPDLYSHRRDGPRTGRTAGYVWLPPLLQSAGTT